MTFSSAFHGCGCRRRRRRYAPYHVACQPEWRSGSGFRQVHVLSRHQQYGVAKLQKPSHTGGRRSPIISPVAAAKTPERPDHETTAVLLALKIPRQKNTCVRWFRAARRPPMMMRIDADAHHIVPDREALLVQSLHLCEVPWAHRPHLHPRLFLEDGENG